MQELVRIDAARASGRLEATDPLVHAACVALPRVGLERRARNRERLRSEALTVWEAEQNVDDLLRG